VRRETGGDDIANFSGLFLRSPLLAGCMSIFLLSLAGIPPFAGFFGKFYLFSAALHAGGNYGLLWLVVVALFGSFISLYYYLMVLKTIFVDERLPGARQVDNVMPDLLARTAIALLAAAVLLLGLAPAILTTPILAAL
jgi:NADH-quinone oxidoreductase subunit N